jgi:apolipoprotein D and lipocalin family protein
MAREPSIPDDEYDDIVEFVGSIGYDVSKIERVPQRW